MVWVKIIVTYIKQRKGTYVTNSIHYIAYGHELKPVNINFGFTWDVNHPSLLQVQTFLSLNYIV